VCFISYGTREFKATDSSRSGIAHFSLQTRTTARGSPALLQHLTLPAGAGGGKGAAVGAPARASFAANPSRVLVSRDSPAAQEPGTVRRSLCSPGEGRPCADAEDLGVEAEGGRLRRTRGEKTSKVRAPEMASSPSSFDYSVLRVRKAERWRLDGRVEELRRSAHAQARPDAEPRHRPGLQGMPWSVSIIRTAIFKSLSGQDVDSR
jgi:hypothetical protein